MASFDKEFVERVVKGTKMPEEIKRMQSRD